MLSEEGIILMAALVAAGLLVLGVLELVWPTRPRHLLGGGAGAGRWRRHARRGRSLRRRGTADRGRPHAPGDKYPATAVVPDAGESALPAEPAPALVAEPIETAPRLLDMPSYLETAEDLPARDCFAAWEGKRFAEVVERATAALEAQPAPPPEEAARLWGILGLARHALDDDDGARAALHEAIRIAPPSDKATWQRHLATLALAVGKALFARAHTHAGVETLERVTAIRSAIEWLDDGRVAVPPDAQLRDALATARKALWPMYERAAAALIQRQEFDAARGRLREALAEAKLPAAQAQAFHDLIASTFSAEIGQLTATAIREMHEGREAEALSSLERGEALLASVPGEDLSAKRRQELGRRLWWAYTKLGMRRLESGMFEAAIEPLFHGLALAPGQLETDETRQALTGTLESLAAERAVLMRHLAEAGDRDAAVVQGEKTRGFLTSGLDRGLSAEDLGRAFATVKRAFERLDGAKA